MGSTEKVTTELEMTPHDAGAGRFGRGAILNVVTARAHQRTPDQPCADCLDHPLGTGRRKPAVPRRGAFWLVALILAVTMLGTTLPTPLYVLYQAQWHFSAAIVLGLFSALAPTFLGGVLHEGSHAVQGAVVFLLMAVGTVTQLLLSRFSSRRVVLAGLGLFLAALALIVAALSQAAMALFLAGTVVGGAAVGAVFLGSLATANRLAPPGRRGQVVSAYFVLCYCGLIIPVVGVGVASGFIGDFRAVLAFSILLAALCLFSLAGIWRALLPPGRQAPPIPAPPLAGSKAGRLP